MTQNRMTDAEAERLRELLGQYDQANGGKKDKEFDLANPPRSISSGGTVQSEQYSFQKYPLHMTKPRKGKPDVTKEARSESEEEALEAKGYLDPVAYRAHIAALPPPVDHDDDEDEDNLDEDAILVEIEAASGDFDPNAEPAKPKARGGRPRKS